MCLPKEFPNTKTKTPPRSPWRRLRTLKTPRLTRRVVPSARVNLNDFWSRFEERATVQRLPLLEMPGASTISDNEINDNILNELTEIRK